MIAEIDHDLDPANAKEFIVGHSDDLEEAEKLASLLKEKYPDASISIQELGPVIGCHVGPGFLAFVYYQIKKVELHNNPTFFLLILLNGFNCQRN